jgi:thiol-disulfide isomerase/thioredoxin
MTDWPDEADRGAVAVEEIDGSFVPVREERILARKVGDEVVLIDETSGIVHALNPVGALVWECFDGDGDLRTLIDDLAENFQAPRAVVDDDVMNLVRTLGGLGLLAGVRPPTPEAVTPTGLSVGDKVTLRVPDLSGDAVDVPRAADHTLLVNWSPHCGFCVGATDALAELTDELTTHGTELVLMTTGDVATNRALLSEHGLRCTAVLGDALDEESDPFAGMGTPVAYVLDRDGRVEEDLAYGADVVVALARRLAGRKEDDGTGVKYAPAGAGGVCGPGASGKAATVWTPTETYEIGDYRVGVRADSAAAADLVRKALVAYGIEADDKTPANFSVKLGEPPTGSSRQLRMLLQGSTMVARSRSPRRVMTALANYLSALTREPGGGLVVSRNLAVVLDGQAVLLPPWSRNMLEQLQPRLARIGAALVDAPHALVDTSNGTLIVPAPTVELDASVLDLLDEPVSSRMELPPVAPGNYPVAVWAVWTPGAEAAEATPAQQLCGALVTVEPEGETGSLSAAADALEPMLDRVTVLSIDMNSWKAENLVRSISAALAR